jgi:hypothetical protein
MNVGKAASVATPMLLAIVALELALLVARPVPKPPIYDGPTFAQIDDLHARIDQVVANQFGMWTPLYTICAELDQGISPPRDRLGNELDCGSMPVGSY